MRIVVKIGGAQLAEPAARRTFAESIASAIGVGHKIVVVHGGGEQLRQLTDRLGMDAPRKVRGLRVTDAGTAEAAVMVLGGTVNRGLVHAIGAAGVRAVGLTGADGGLFWARPIAPDLGFVGAAADVDPAILIDLTARGYVPVIASLAPLAPDCEGDGGTLYNINADQVVAPVARAFGADAVLFLTDVDGVRDSDGAVLRELDLFGVGRRIESGAIHGGMIPKVEAACDAARQCPDATVRIALADRADAVRYALTKPTGTTFVTDEASSS